MSAHRVLVCGGRDYGDRQRVIRELDELAGLYGPDAPPMPRPGFALAHGACPTGADRWADEWAVINWVAAQEFPADWRVHGRAAGPIRNGQMLADFRPTLVLAFPGGRGTADMVRRAKAAGVPVKEIAP